MMHASRENEPRHRVLRVRRELTISPMRCSTRAMDWLQQVAQLPVTQLRPATRSCVAQAMLFYPKLEAAFSVQELDTELDGLF